MFGFNPDKLSIKCHLAIKRMGLVRNRKNMQIHGLKQEVADMLKAGQDQNARIRVEEVIRQEMMLEAYAILETYLLLLQTRAGMLKKAKEPPPDMEEGICTIMFASERVKYELDEFPAIAAILMSKFRSPLCNIHGKDFPQAIMEEGAAYGRLPINSEVAACLSVNPANQATKIEKLEEIAKKFGAPFDAGKAAVEMMPKNARMPQAASSYDQPAQKGTNFYMQQTAPPPAPPRRPAFQPAAREEPPPVQKRPPPPDMPFPPPPATRPTNPPPASPQTGGSPSPWAPLPPLNNNLGYTFDTKLDQVAQWMHTKRSGSQSPGVSGDGTPIRGNSLNNPPQREDSVSSYEKNSSSVVQEQPDLPEGLVESEEEAAESNAGGEGSGVEGEAEDDTDSIAARLAALRAL